MFNKTNSRGFSLIELLVVVAVIAILAAVAIPAYYNHILRVNQANAANKLLDIKAAQEMYYAQYDFYADWTFSSPDGTFQDLLNFNITDSSQYVFSVSTTAGGAGFTAQATGQSNTKYKGNVIEITDDSDPDEVNEPDGFKLSLLFE